ncbi:Alpha/Beta hydrolase protein, partial [Baffinella frigidus]
VAVLLHGAGHCAQSWSALVSRLNGAVKVIALDHRGHGASRASDEGDLRQGPPPEPAAGLVRSFRTPMRDDGRLVVLVGHSMGGSVAVRSVTVLEEAGFVVRALVVLDTSEGTAVAAFGRSMAGLRLRPKSFPCVADAVTWALDSKLLHSRESAELSIPCMVVEDGSGGVKWRADVEGSAPHWEGWFKGMSSAFLAVPSRIPKLLVLSSRDNLDTTLVVGQMQGGFQLEVLQGGHAIHEVC